MGVVVDGGTFHLIARLEKGKEEDHASTLGYLVSRDGHSFELQSLAILPLGKIASWEDPRVTKIGDTFYIVCAVLSRAPAQGGSLPQAFLISTKDFREFEEIGVIAPPHTHSRDTVLFPEKINGRYAALWRPRNWTQAKVSQKGSSLFLTVTAGYPPYVKKRVVPWPLEERPGYFPQKPSIWIGFSDDLKRWSGFRAVLEPTENDWENVKIGAGPPPIKTKKGWLVIYHGVGRVPENFKGKFKRHDGREYNWIYRVGAALLDLENPQKVIARTSTPILWPKEPYEMEGNIPNVVFPTGACVQDDKLFLYYGAADKYCCLATCSMEELLETLTPI